MLRLLIILLPLMSSCSFKTLYPTIGATTGAGVGGILGGPGGAALGGFAGAASGEILKADKEVKEAMETVEAVTEGDVKKLVELKLGEQQGWFDKTVDGIYDILMISAFAMVLYFVFHFWYGRKFAKQLSQQAK